MLSTNHFLKCSISCSSTQCFIIELLPVENGELRRDRPSQAHTKNNTQRRTWNDCSIFSVIQLSWAILPRSLWKQPTAGRVLFPTTGVTFNVAIKETWEGKDLSVSCEVLDPKRNIMVMSSSIHGGHSGSPHWDCSQDSQQAKKNEASFQKRGTFTPWTASTCVVTLVEKHAWLSGPHVDFRSSRHWSVSGAG